jgi:hypothetical protein
VANKNEEESTLKDQFQADIDRYVQLHATANHN